MSDTAVIVGAICSMFGAMFTGWIAFQIAKLNIEASLREATATLKKIEETGEESKHILNSGTEAHLRQIVRAERRAVAAENNAENLAYLAEAESILAQHIASQKRIDETAVKLAEASRPVGK